MKIIDSEGREVKRGTILESAKHRSQAKKVYCVGVTKQYAILDHDQQGSLPWVLTVDQMAKSQWAVSGWRDLNKESLGR